VLVIAASRFVITATVPFSAARSAKLSPDMPLPITKKSNFLTLEPYVEFVPKVSGFFTREREL
jgi:hypothetical protein